MSDSALFTNGGNKYYAVFPFNGGQSSFIVGGQQYDFYRTILRNGYQFNFFK